MVILQTIFNFDDIGGKIKNFAKWYCWIMILLTWISAAICFIILLFTKGTFLIAFLVPIIAILYSLFIWVSSWATYAFGEYVEDTKAIRYNTAIIAQPIMDAKAEKAQQKTNKQPTLPKPIETAKSNIVPARTDKPSKTDYAEGEYVSGRTYTNGDTVIFEGKKYNCVVDSTVWSPGVSPSQWQECSPSETGL